MLWDMGVVLVEEEAEVAAEVAAEEGDVEEEEAS